MYKTPIAKTKKIAFYLLKVEPNWKMGSYFPVSLESTNALNNFNLEVFGIEYFFQKQA